MFSSDTGTSSASSSSHVHHHHHASSSNSSASILSEKVQRALQLRTDTPAMKAALDALGQLNNSEGLDARSVRHAIEHDALEQALQLRSELRRLCSSLHELRQGISETARTAHRVQQAIRTHAVVRHDATGSTGGEDFAAATSSAVADLDGSNNSNTATVWTASDGTLLTPEQDEERLAARLAQAFAKRNVCQERLTAVHQFLDTFYLSEEDARLLEHYQFDDVADLGQRNVVHGHAFLKALERVKEIRQALSQTFGTSSTSGAGGDMGRFLSADASSSSSSSSLGASSALRMMEQLAQKQEQAYERLYQWLQSHLQLFAANPKSTASSKQPAQHKKLAFAVHDPDDPDQDGSDNAFGDSPMDRALQHPFVQAALYTLRNVPAFYKHTLELIASRRRQDQTRLFLLALTSGLNGLPPMERLAHDPVVYVGDQLAFAFKSLNVEADVAVTIVHYRNESEDKDNDKDDNDDGKPKDKENDEPEEGVNEKDALDDTTNTDEYYNTEKPMSASDMLSTSLSGMARPLKSRIVGVIAQLASRVDKHSTDNAGGDVSDTESDDGVLDDFEEEGAIVRNKLTHLYDICGLLLFYLSAYTKTIAKVERADRERGLLPSSSSSSDEERVGSNNALWVNVSACLNEGVKAFEATVRTYSAMMGSLSVSSGESVASLAKALIVRIAQVRQASPGFADDVPCPDQECETTLSTTWITTQVIEAALPFCTRLDDDTVELKSAIESVKQAGMDTTAAQRLDHLIDQTVLSLVDTLMEQETAEVLQKCGLVPLVSAWEQWKASRENESAHNDDTTTTALMASYPGLSEQEVAAATKEFYNSLFSPPLPSLEGAIQDPEMRQSTRTKIAGKVCNIYQELYDDLTDSYKGGYSDLSFLGHTPEQVTTLFAA